MAKVRPSMFSHLPEVIQEMYEIDEEERVDYFFDEFYSGGPVVMGKVFPVSEEKRQSNRSRVYHVAGEIINEIAETETKKISYNKNP